MASRAMKRAQGDALTRAAEEAFAGEDSSSSESEDDAPARPANAFALLLGSDDDDDEEEEEEEREPEPQPEPEPVKAKKSKKKKKKASVSRPEDAVDEVTAALRELGEEMPTTTVSTDDLHDLSSRGGTHGAHALTAERNALVAVDRNRVKAEDELKSIFGARAIRAVEAEEGGRARTSSRGGGGGHARSSRGFSHAGHKSMLVTPKDTWPAAPSTRGSGFAMQSLGSDRDGVAVFRFVHDTNKEDARDFFERAKASHDPNALVRLLHHHPWNAQALLALADIHTYTGEGQRSAEMLERCVYAMESAWHPAFAEAATRGAARLRESLDDATTSLEDDDDGSHGSHGSHGETPTPNRTFLDAMFKHTQALTRRGCHRAALECAKLSLSLDRSDPTGLLCAVDYFALRCGETDWLLDFAGEFREDGSALALPGFAFSAALARMGGGRPGRVFGSRDAGAKKKKARQRAEGDDADASDSGKRETEDALLRALLMHPAALMALLRRIDSSAVNGDARWAAALTHPHFASARDAVGNRGLEHLCDLFAERHHLLWKPDDALGRLREACLKACAVVDDPDATVDGLRAADYAAMREETFPPADADRNPWAHLSTEDFSDVVKRQMPEGDENPFLARPAGNDAGDIDPDLLADAAAMLRGGRFDAEAAAAAGLDPEALRAMAAHLQGGAGAAEMLERAREQIGDENPRALGLLDFFRPMLVPQDGGGGLQREMARQNAPPREERED